MAVILQQCDELWLGTFDEGLGRECVSWMAKFRRYLQGGPNFRKSSRQSFVNVLRSQCNVRFWRGAFRGLGCWH